ncbi:hypothetical protein DLAC_09827 [Tieghemostelium lacteum]|uniref:Methyltransferase type 11 domain-containing protein n=1 Tax=Tieghemostelium lacteum TaxID=361077 RepID=A0A151Z7B5_TIELA|nr:hypothetical protein DLAC_09827 [Tieghemostelium lacteum]|eukprot:KYQ89852.1 hypothetical protein DLAC_09827 [Tieghemostelium lacteum]
MYLFRSINIKYKNVEICKRFYSSSSVGGNYNKMNIFDSTVKTIQKNNVARLEDSRDYDYLFREVGDRLCDRILDIKDMNKSVYKILDFGSRYGTMNSLLEDKVFKGLGNGTQQVELYMVDTASTLLDRDKYLQDRDGKSVIECKRVLVESLETPLPFEKESFDLVISNLSLHWINDLPGVFSGLKQLLKPNGVFLASLFGEETLSELKDSLYLAEIEREGGFSPHISPFTKISDIGNLLQRARFNLPTIDTEKIQIQYKNAFTLMRDLQNMGENNAILKRRNYTSRDTFMAAASIYENLYGSAEKVPATFQIIYLIGWAPHASQPKPKPRGSATKRFSDLESTLESFKFNDESSSKIQGQEKKKPEDGEKMVDISLDEPIPVTSDFIIKRLDKFGNLHTVNSGENKHSEESVENIDIKK